MNFLLELEKKYGYRVGWAPISLLDEIAEEMKERKNEFSAYQKKYFADWPDLQKARNSGMKSVIIISFPVGELNCFHLDFDFGRIDAKVPAGYRNAQSKYGVVYHRLTELLDRAGIHCTEIQSNLKNIAVRTGLAEYGRNDLTYVPGFGSYHALVGAVCDADFTPAAYPSLQKPHRMARCASCGLCAKACSTGAIPADSSMIDMERCVTLYNEESSEWPDWLSPKKSRYLIGCASCQLCCPANRGLLSVHEPYTFTLTETEAIVKGAPADAPVWKDIQKQIDAIGLNGFEYSVFHNIKQLYRANCPAETEKTE